MHLDNLRLKVVKFGIVKNGYPLDIIQLCHLLLQTATEIISEQWS